MEMTDIGDLKRTEITEVLIIIFTFAYYHPSVNR